MPSARATLAGRAVVRSSVVANPRDTELTVVARALASARRSSVVVIEITHDGHEIACEDAGALRADDGEEVVLTALVLALRALLVNTEAALAVTQQAASPFRNGPPS